MNPRKSRISYHTERGYVTFLDNASKFNKIIAIKSAHGYNFTNLYKRLVNYFKDNSYQVEIFLHALLSEGYEGIYIPKQELWIIDEKLLSKHVSEQCERIDFSNMYDNFSLLQRQREINILEGEIERLLQYVYKHYNEACVYKKQKDTLLSQMLNKQLYDGKREKLFHFLFNNKITSTSTGVKIRRFYKNNEDIFSYLPTDIKVKNDITFITLNNGNASTILEEVERKAIKQNFTTLGLVHPTFTSKPSIVYIPELTTVILNERFLKRGYNQKTFDFSSCFTSQYYDTTTKKSIYDLETNIKIKTTLGKNYLKEVKQRYKELCRIYEESLIAEKENQLMDLILQKVNQ